MKNIIRNVKGVWDFVIDAFAPLKKQTITLEQNDKGIYVIKAYGMYLTNTLTTDKEQAEKNFNDAVDHARGKNNMNHVIIKEATITKNN